MKSIEQHRREVVISTQDTNVWMRRIDIIFRLIVSVGIIGLVAVAAWRMSV